MKCICCHKRDIPRKGRAARLLLCSTCDIALEIAGTDEGREIQKNRAKMNALNYYEYWRDHRDEVEEPPFGQEFLRMQDAARRVAEELREVERINARREKDRERNRRYYRAHREEVLARTSEYQRTHREEQRESHRLAVRRWERKHIEWNRERNRRYYWEGGGKELEKARRSTQEYREKNRLRMAEWRKAHPDRVREFNKAYYNKKHNNETANTTTN